MSQPRVPREPRRKATSPKAESGKATSHNGESRKAVDPEGGHRPETKQRDTSGTHVWLVLMKAFKAMAQHAEQSLRGAELAFSEFMILEALLSKGPLQVNDIGRRVNLTSGAMTSAIDRLEERGLVQRAVDDADKRARVVSLTHSGRALIATTFDAHKARMDAAADTLTAKERRTLIDLLKKLGLGAVEKLAQASPRPRELKTPG
jgi:MarR family transcriptional regulator, 2-MHQ and catechol-resistance regulon repressor